MRAIAFISASSKIWSISEVILGRAANFSFFILGDRLLFKEALVALKALGLLALVLTTFYFFIADIDIFFFFFSFYSWLSLADNFD